MDTIARVEAALKKRKWTWTELARQADVLQPCVSAFKTGRRGLSRESAQKISEALGGEITQGDLLSVEPKSIEKKVARKTVRGLTRRRSRRAASS